MKPLKRLGTLVLTALAIGLLAGCGMFSQLTGAPPPTDFNQKALAAELTIKTVLDSATLLRTAGKITSADVKSIDAATAVAQQGVDVARALRKLECPAAPPTTAATAPPAPCTPVKADNRLQLALAGLTALQAYLATTGATP